MRSRGRSWLGVALVAAIVTAGVGSLAPDAGAAPVAYRSTPVAGWQTNGTVWTVLVVGDTVYAGGSFTQVRSPSGQTLTRNRLAAFDRVTGAIRTGFTADTNNTVRSLAYSNGVLYVGGNFTTIRSVGKQRLAAVDAATGAVVTGWTANTSSNVLALEVKGNRLYAGGLFTTVGGQPRNRIAAVSTVDGAVDPTFNPDANNEVRALAISPDGSIVYAGGLYTSIGGVNRSYLVPLSSTTGAPLPLAFERGDRARVFDLDISPDGSQLFAGLGGLENRAEAWSTRTGARQWQQIAMGDTQAIRYSEGNVYFSFHEGFQNDTSVRVLAADAATGALVPTFRPPINTFYAAWALDASADALVIGGEFTVVGGVPARGVAIMPTVPTAAPSPPTNVAVTATSATTISLAWSPGTDEVGVAGYRVLRDGVVVGYPTTTAFTDTGLAPNTDYTYTVQTEDTSGTFSVPSPPVNTGTDLTLVPAHSTWRYLDDGSNQGTAWRTPAFDASSWAQGPGELGYGDGDEATVVGFGGSTNQKYVTTYFRRQLTVANPASVGALTLRLLRDDGAVVYLNGTEVARSGLPAGAISSTTLASTTIDGAAERAYTPFSVSPALLTPGTNTLAVEIHQASRGSSDISFDLSVDSARAVAPPAPSDLHTTAVGTTTVDLAWTPPAGTIAGFRVYRDGALVGSPGSASFQDTGLTDAHTYSYAVTALDGSAVESSPSTPLPVATLDGTAPGAPTGLDTTSVSGAKVALTWTAPIDNVGVTAYDVLRDDVIVGSPTTTAYSDLSVTPLEAYEYRVQARDAAGNVSLLSDPLAVVTPDGGDLGAPSTPTNLHVVTRSATSVTLAWDASTDDIGVDSYSVLRNGVEVGTPTGTSFTHQPLAPASTGTYTVVAHDGAANDSDPSDPLVVTTHAATESFFPHNTSWRFTQDGIDRGTVWRTPGYDDSSWPTGLGQFGYFDGDETTVMQNGGPVTANVYISHYFRRAFTVSDPQAITALTLSMVRDDGVVVYVNGVEAFRNNMPTGAINYRTFANVAVSGAAESSYFDYAIPPALLVAGQNVIAVEVHNNSRSGSSDLSFDAGLSATYG